MNERRTVFAETALAAYSPYVSTGKLVSVLFMIHLRKRSHT